VEVVITGAAGFIGSALARRLSNDLPVHALVHPRTDPRRLPRHPAVQVHRVDLTSFDEIVRVLATIGPTTVFHAAARGGHAAAGERRTLWHDCVTSTVTLLDALDRVGAAQVVNLGSSNVYAPSTGPLRETDPLHPISARGAAKAAAELAVQEWGSASGVPVTALRLFRVYGPDEQPGRLVPALLHSLRTGEPLPTPTTPTRRDMVHVDDVVEACRRVMVLAGSHVLNVGYGEGHTVEEVAAAFSAAAGRPIRLAPGSRDLASHDLPHHAADMTHASRLLSWRPEIDLHRGAALVLSAS
jgi:nucleoside-diphosphate-sugar epimerase